MPRMSTGTAAQRKAPTGNLGVGPKQKFCAKPVHSFLVRWWLSIWKVWFIPENTTLPQRAVIPPASGKPAITFRSGSKGIDCFSAALTVRNSRPA